MTRPDDPAKGPAAPLWRMIEQAIRGDILAGRYQPGAQLPSDRDLAARYSASRMTARRALASLEQDGLIRIEHGNGTFVSDDARIRYSLGGDRVRFSRNWLSAEGIKLQRRILRTSEVKADDALAAVLGIGIGEAVLTLQIVALAGERPISVGIRHCPAARFRGLDTEFERVGSLTTALKAFGIEDYARASTDVTARLPTPEEARILVQSRAHPVLAFTATDIEAATGAVISYHVGCFAADRVVISIGAG